MISNDLYAIGLTGSICTGKSASERYLQEFFPVIDADQVVHDLYVNDLELIDSIGDMFGSQVVADGVVNRKTLGKIVFSDEIKLSELVALVHPRVTKLILQKISECRDKKQLSIFSIPLLFENAWQKSLDQTIVITCKQDLQIQRIQNRDSKSRKEALQVINNQMPQQEKIAHADFLIENEGTLLELHTKLKALFPQIT